MLIDNHCHINSLSGPERADIFSRDLSEYRFIDSTIDMETTCNSLSLSQWYPCVMTSVGFHPLSGDQYNENTIKEYQDIIDQNKKIVAVGEIGLDYKAPVTLAKQEEIFRAFIELAYRNNLPVIIHNRVDRKMLFEGGTPYILNILSEMVTSYERVMFHCFSFNRKFMDMVVEHGGSISFSLNVLRGNKDILDALKNCPIENILFETDSPYMRISDKPSSPFDIEKVYDLAAQVRGVPRKELEEAAYNNSRKLFKFV